VSRDQQCARGTISVVAAGFLATGLIIQSLSGKAAADPGDYNFTVLARIPGPAPGGGRFDLDFEPYTINGNGSAAFVADLKVANQDIGEGVFVSRQGQLLQIARAGQPAPGGGTFDGGALGHTPLNDAGSGAFVYILEVEPPPPQTLIGLNAGLYRFSLLSRTPTAVVVPGVTTAPTGGTFKGVYYDTSLNNSGDLVFGGIVPGSAGPPGSNGLEVGVFKASSNNNIVPIVVPGDPAPGGRVFDDGFNAWINDLGDVAFEAHVKGDECINFGSDLLCGSSIYKKKKSGEIQSIAHQGDPAPAGGTYRFAFAPVMNNAGDLVFIGDLTPAPDSLQTLGVFSFNSTTSMTSPVAVPGDALPGGGRFKTASRWTYTSYLNNVGDITFVARLEPVGGDGVGDTGLYLVSRGKPQLVARTGSTIPGVGIIAQINPPGNISPPSPFFSPEAASDIWLGGAINDQGQIFFEATLPGGTGVLLAATPRTPR